MLAIIKLTSSGTCLKCLRIEDCEAVKVFFNIERRGKNEANL